MNFMVSGHTKFAPDWCFEFLKQRYRRTPVSSLKDLSDIVNSSTVTGVNVPQLVGLEYGTVFVPIYDWQNYLGPFFKALLGIKQIHHFRFCSSTPGIVHYKMKPNDQELSFTLLARTVTGHPVIIPPPRLPLQRQWYLYNKIREFVDDKNKDVTCPLPAIS